MGTESNFSFGVVFVLILVLIAVVLPQPPEFQQLVFRVVLALAASGIGALVPGFLTIRYKNFLRAGGALAVFAIVYFFSPATLVVSDAPKHAIFPTDPFKITFITKHKANTSLIRTIFPSLIFKTRDLAPNSLDC